MRPRVRPRWRNTAVPPQAAWPAPSPTLSSRCLLPPAAARSPSRCVFSVQIAHPRVLCDLLVEVDHALGGQLPQAVLCTNRARSETWILRALEALEAHYLQLGLPRVDPAFWAAAVRDNCPLRHVARAPYCCQAAAESRGPRWRGPQPGTARSTAPQRSGPVSQHLEHHISAHLSALSARSTGDSWSAGPGPRRLHARCSGSSAVRRQPRASNR